MLIDKFKQSKEVDLLKASEKYVSKHFGILLLKKKMLNSPKFKVLFLLYVPQEM
jgi:hypothetical protein